MLDPVTDAVRWSLCRCWLMHCRSILPPSSHTAAILYNLKDLRIENTATVAPEPNEVQIAPKPKGICDTDMHYYRNGCNGIYPVQYKNP
ncbi:hypothetical protein F4782DRAFT_491639 [Xylaria castorea]|nr:hypothetical protein F4782DRAFT_491639 [Xylaria castorea]